MLILLLDLLGRSALILLAAEALRCTPRLLTASQRHRLLLSSFAMLLGLPVLSLILPAWRLVWPVHTLDSSEVKVSFQLFTLRSDHLASPKAISWSIAIWSAGFLFSVMPLALAHLRLLRLKRVARPVSLTQYLAASTPSVEICDALILQRRVMPMTCGWFRPKLLLPQDFQQWPPALQRAVLLHELAHAERRDVVLQEIARLIAALWWFQPLVWRTVRHLRAESEHACDEAVIRAGVRGSDYASSLLQIARQFGTAGCVCGAAAMACSVDVSTRIRRILVFRPVPPVRRRVVTALLALAGCTATAAALDIPYLDPIQSTGGVSSMKRLILFTLAGLSAQTFHAAATEPPQAQQQQQQSAKPIRVNPDLAQNNLVHQVKPVYPPKAKEEGIQGTVVLDVTISKEGVPQDIDVLSAPSEDLAISATDAVQQWRWRSTLLNGQPVEVTTEVRVTYTLTR